MFFLRIFIEVSFLISLFINACLFVPQVIKLYRVKNSQGLSLTTFLGFNLIQAVIIIHAVLRKDWLLVIGTSLSLITCGAVNILIILYRTPSKPVELP